MTYDDAGSGPRTARTGRPTGGCLDRPPDPLPTRVDSLPVLPNDVDVALTSALRALQVELTEPARRAIDDHVRLLLAWNSAINLTAIRDPVEIAIRHVADSLVAIPILRSRGVDRFVDLGSGGGYPALPLAAALPADRAILVESIAKKTRFLDAAIAAMGLAQRVRAIPIRAEALARDAGQRGRWPAVTARAVASLPDLVELALPFLRPGGLLLAWKSGDPDDPDGLGGELGAADRALAAVGDGGTSVGEPVSEIVADASEADRAALAAIHDHRLVLVERGRRPIASEWPRDPAARKRRPW